jgi:ABC-type multidrug transport system fused ATPase/permease subunit
VRPWSTVGGDEARALPRLLTGNRRWFFAGLVLAGLVQSAAAAATVVALTRGLNAGTRKAEILTVVVLVLVAGVLGWTRSRERLLSERLGQDYAHEIRLCLVRQVLDGHRRSSLGTTLTRASNDLSAVRNWVALGIGPTAVGIPLVLGCTVVLGAIDPLLAFSVLVPLLALALVLWAASRAAYDKSRRVRLERGRLAGHLADTLTATMAIRSAGGEYRELKRLDDRSSKVVQAAIDRARVVGRIRGASTAATGLATASVIACSMLANLSGAHLAAALTVVGLLSSPVQNLGRVVEYRQNFRAARAVLAPALQPSPRPSTSPSPSSTLSTRAQTPGTDSDATASADWVRQHEPLATFDGQVGLVVHGLRIAAEPDVEVPALYARPGDRVAVRSEDRAWTSSVLGAVVGLERPLAGQVRVKGKDLAATPFREHRTLLGYAAQGMRLERTSISRAVRYRHPDAAAASVGDMLARVGLAERVASLPGGEKALLRQGGEPLTLPDRARLLLARAVFGQPPLLVLDHLDAEIGHAGRAEMREVLRDYPGVVLLASDQPEDVMSPTRQWDLDSGRTGR